MNRAVKRLLVLFALFLSLLSCRGLSQKTPEWNTVALVIATSTVAPTITSGELLTPFIAETQEEVESTERNGQIAREHLEALAETIGARLPGSPEEEEAAQYIQTAFEEIGYDTVIQPFSVPFDDGDKIDSANVIAIKPGLSSEVIVVGAHYDSGNEGEGADDNASGVAVMLETAEKISKIDTPYTIQFIAFGAEEEDLNGSRYYVDQMSDEEIDHTVAMINLDSLAAGDIAYVYGDTGTEDSLRDWILGMAKDSGYNLEGKSSQALDGEDGTSCECADYHPFQQAGVPFAFFESTNWNLGDKDGWTQVDPKYGDDGGIMHSEFDRVDDIDRLFPGRIDQHLELYVSLLFNTLTQYE